MKVRASSFETPDFSLGAIGPLDDIRYPGPFEDLWVALCAKIDPVIFTRFTFHYRNLFIKVHCSFKI